MIDTAIEEAITLNAARRLPALRRDGRSPDLCTIYRWISRGVAGVTLESVKVGGARCTSAEAVRRFLDRLADPDPSPSVMHRTPHRRELEIEAAERETAEIG